MSGLLTLGARAMFANQAALQTIGQNIANANTAGYSRQSVVLTTPDGQYTGAGFFGKGVNVETVMRSHNEFLTREAASTKSIAYMDSTRMDQMSQLEKVFPTAEEGLGYAVSQFLNSMSSVSANPADPSARQVVLGKASDLAARFSSAGQQLASLQAGVVSDLKANVDIVNQLAQQIAAANDQVARANGTGHDPNDLLDKRDQLISQLSQYVQVSTLPADNGTLGVFIGGGQRLVLGAQAQPLSVTADPYDPSRATLSISESSGPRTLDASVLTGGSITALLQFQNDDLQDARNMLGQMASALASRVNDQQALGLDQSDPPGKGAPMFGLGAPRALPASTNARNPDGSYVSTVSVSITDATQLQAASYKLSSSPSGVPGEYQLTRLSDGLSRTVVDGDTVDGFQLNLGANAPGAGDSFLIEPVANAAIDMKRALDAPAGIAAAAPLTASVNVNNTGTATVASLSAVNSKVDPTQAPMSLAFGTVDPADASRVLYTLTLADGSTLSGSWKAGEAIGNTPNANPPIDLGFELKLNGVPRNGDTMTLSATQFTSTNNGNAQAFLGLLTEGMVGRSIAPDGSTIPGSNINDAYASALSEIGSRVQGATYLSGVSTSVAADAETTRSGQDGVNIDEEAARLMQFQQGYQAAAKILQTAQALFDELLKIAG
ncbi:MAG: flagellar hook-associated protein FlgK [Burkholderiaceae bacterium]